ncbi:hypothetical protein E3P92_04017 [Wallemia ichthyophaga]|uniref:Ornithine aminotransferase n=1 Tax=Wallemia ichthyophaga TaxID=245174 RepID=A0A4T0GAY2_WALIC|nr:hypothetical protein E3P95_02789 [Wallemia ichthyophaga]TIA98800.1 hypothetical protein E3P94_02792 [Wallemia ichthyophaga]TIB07504.1 hypothetical protein E3P92_04017 [Wallemia ichthyophaga]TIB10919.1 hypothetical protein E3P90_02628 [Wallemia ichthyophaga]TIB11206.1 hypothetical protein E3P93_02636 [Wallemia ichthyophaga]
MRTTDTAIALENAHSAHNYHPLPVVLERGEGARVWDVEGASYLDFLSAYSAVNQGHSHPRILSALTAQASKLTLSSRAFHNDVFPAYARKLTSLLHYDMVLPMNTGAEAVETALKMARRWAYRVKGVSEDQARVFAPQGNFHGRTIAAISLSSDPASTTHYGPFVPGLQAHVDGRPIQYGSIDDLHYALSKYGHSTAAFLVEPIQGEAGIVVPNEDYLRAAKRLCEEYNVLFIADEIQTGLGRTGKMLCSEHSGVRPDIVTLGKALGGGVYPVSAVLADKPIMLTITEGSHGSTFGGNPLASAVAMAALDVIVDEHLCDKAVHLGNLFRDAVSHIPSPLILQVRGKGLLNAVVIDESQSKRGRGAMEICLLLKHYGLLAKPTQKNIIRFAPPLVIDESDLLHGVEIIQKAILNLDVVDDDLVSEHVHV